MNVAEAHPAHISRAPVPPLRTAVLHLGLGAFHRAHQAYFFDRLLESGNRDWGIASVNLRSRAVVDALSSQENSFIRWERGSDTENLRSIRSITGSYHLPTQRADVLALFANPDIRLITMTVSEKGYHYDPETGGLDTMHPDIQSDLANPETAGTLPGLLVQGLEVRRLSGGGPISLVSCDNYRRNGAILRSAVTAFAQEAAPDLPIWLENNARFLSSMVDGIVPKVQDEDRAALKRQFGADDPAMVVAEDYMCWVIEDDFLAERPPLESAGVEFVANVAPYEAIKLLLLNAPHSAAAYLGHNAGISFIDEAVTDPALHQFLEELISEDLLPVAVRKNTAALDYGSMTLKRFANPNIRYLTRQVATDGSLKLRERLFPALSRHLEKGDVPDGIALVLAAWMRFLRGETESGDRYSIPDPNAEAFAAKVASTSGGEGLVDEILSMRDIIPPDIAKSEPLRHRIKLHFNGLAEHRTRPWLKRVKKNKDRRQP